jgi:hypothetical protein
MLNKHLFKEKDAHVMLGFGLRYSINLFRNDGAFTVFDSLGTTQFGVYTGQTVRTSYSFSNRFFEIPLELRLRYYGFDNTMRFSIGAVLGVRERVFEQARIGTTSFFQESYPDLSAFRYGLFLRGGFKRIGLYAGYYINPIFKNRNSSQLHVFNLGLNFAL